MPLPSGLPVTSYTPITTSNGINTPENIFRNAYMASLDPAREALTLNYYLLVTQGFPTYNPSLGQELLDYVASLGLPVDRQIMLDGWDSWTTMKARQGAGDTWVPSVGQNFTTGAPTLPFLGFNGPMPAGAILVSTEPSDYPPYQPPTPVEPPATTHFPVGPRIGASSYFEVNPPDPTAVGQSVTGTTSFGISGTFTKQYYGQPSLFGGTVSQVYKLG